MFAPPEPKISTERILAAAVVPLYQASASQKALWELGQKKHQRAMAAVVKSTDQSEPQTSTDVSLHRAWERSKAFQEDLQLRHIADGNKKLIGHLAQIVSQPSAIAKQASQPRVKVPQRGREAEKRRIKEVSRENELLVKRLLNVKPSLNRQADERDYARHRRNMERMKKIAPPPPRPARSQPRLAPLPEQPALQDCDHEAGTFIPAGGARRTLPPLPKGIASSRSAPALTNHASPGRGGGAAPPGGAPGAPLEEAQASASSWRRPRPASGSGGLPESRPGGPGGHTSVASSTCQSFRPRSQQTIEAESMEELPLGESSPPDTPALARSIVAGSLPPLSPCPSDHAPG